LTYFYKKLYKWMVKFLDYWNNIYYNIRDDVLFLLIMHYPLFYDNRFVIYIYTLLHNSYCYFLHNLAVFIQNSAGVLYVLYRYGPHACERLRQNLYYRR